MEANHLVRIVYYTNSCTSAIVSL